MERVVIKYNDDKGLCPKCNNKAEYQEEWDRLFDTYDKNTPQMIMVVQRLYEENVPKYICNECKVEILVRP